MDPKASWRKYMTLVPENSSAVTGTQTNFASGKLKRRRVHDEDEKHNAKRKLTEYNVTSSPLLRIPAEIRRMIFAHVLGGHYVHVEQLHLGNVDRYEKKDIYFGQGLWNEICHEPDLEATAYKSFRDAKMGSDAAPTPYGKTKDGEDLAQGYHVDSWTYRHRECGKEPELHRFNIALEEWKARKSLSLGCLRTCRLVHKEMRTLPYSENTFLFRNPTTFQTFVSSIRAEQLRALQRLSLPIAVGSAPFSEGRNKLWTSILWNSHLANRMQKLRHVDITVELYFPRDAFQDRNQQVQAQPSYSKPRIEDCIDSINVSGTHAMNTSTDWTKQFARLSPGIPNFRIVVCDDPLSMWGIVGRVTAIRDWRIRDERIWMGERNQKCLTVEQKQALGQELEERLRAEAKLG
ncbi:uncharacterized protein PV09_02864 [Verruconis gallopava]|uniref:DUF7730 domain-containing protein n=1 Tax=Verruconis gallopava TaxID=253628 RepID=A0A0D2AHN7_9PEZI|nr:uncharacterized protein PV09_02864 [Verruconis gallopava]KIW06413.1 hypothetical protein PV09_02864 [Verruconis gallopava]